jgi:hypothetical protein
MARLREIQVPFDELTAVAIRCTECKVQMILDVADEKQSRIWMQGDVVTCDVRAFGVISLVGCGGMHGRPRLRGQGRILPSSRKRPFRWHRISTLHGFPAGRPARN